MPIGTDLVLREQSDDAAILLDGERLGAVYVEAARRYKTPLAIPLMDLTVEKEALLGMIGVPAEEVPTYHFHSAPDARILAAVEAGLKGPLTPRLAANADAIRFVARNSDLVPCGMSIGPFSFMTKLIADPIGPVYMSGTGVTGDEDPEVKALELALELAIQVILWSVMAQIEAGAKLIVVCEPAANLVYISPKQLSKGSDVLERLVMAPNRRLKALLDAHGVGLFFHDCGELMDEMVPQFATLRPAIMSLGSSRKLWEDAARVPKDIVLFGNLPTKKFFSEEMTVAEVQRQACELLARMKQAGHPYILGSECDVLSVPSAHQAITEKVGAFMRVGC
jgi:uroporphyrinogen-III decarboxylase